MVRLLVFQRLEDHARRATVIASASIMLASAPFAHADKIFNGSAPCSSTIGCWYTPWWDPGSGQPAVNWANARYCPYYKDSNNQLVYGYYTQTVLQTQKYQSEQMASVGIQFIVSDFTNGVGVGNSLSNTLQFLQNGLPAAAAIGGPLWNSANATLDTINNAAQLESNNVYNTLVANQNNYFHFNGLPLLVTYMAYDQGKATVPLPYWYDYRFSVARATGKVDANNPILNFATNGYNWDAWWGWNVSNTVSSATCMAICPGFDTTHFGDGSGQSLSRNQGSTYMDQWIAALKKNPQVIMISSWNDYNEENMIEPCNPISQPGAPGWLDANGYQTSDLYLKITRAYTALKSKRLLSGYYYRDESNSRVYLVNSNNSLQSISQISQISPNSPIIKLPSNWLTQIRNSNKIIP